MARWKRALTIFGVVILILVGVAYIYYQGLLSPSQNPVVRYALGKNVTSRAIEHLMLLWDNDSMLDPNDKRLIDELALLPQSLQENDSVLSSLDLITVDGKVTDGEIESLQDLDEDELSNYDEIFELGTDPLKYDTWLKFVYNVTKRPSDTYTNNQDTRELAAVFNYIQFLDENSSVIKSIKFDPGDEKYLRSGWDIEEWGNLNGSWSGNNSVIVLDISEEAHFLKFEASSIGMTDYQDLEVGFKELMAHPNEMNYNDELIDKIPLYGRMQIHYANLRPELDSDGDGIINNDDPNPRIPEPKPVKGDVNVAVYYVTGWGKRIHHPPNDWSVGSPLHPLLGPYDSDDPDISDWHIKWSMEHGVNIFVIPYTKPLWGWETNFEDGFMRTKYLEKVRFAIAYNPPYTTKNISLEEQTNETISYCSENYFDHPSYLKIENKPSIFLYHAGIFHGSVGEGEFVLFTQQIRDIANKCGYDTHLIGDVIEHDHRNADLFFKHFDAVTAYGIPIFDNANIAQIVRSNGGEYISAGKQSHFRMPAKKE